MPQAGFDDALAALRRESGVDFARVRSLLCHLAVAGPQQVGALVEATATPHRLVLDVLHALGIGVEGEAIRLEPSQAEVLRHLLDCPDPGGEPDGLPRLTAPLAEVAAGLPPSQWNLDHVPATVATMVDRARYLASRYHLGGAHLLALGDHDLTSVASALAAPDATVSVVDIDERLLEYLDRVSGRLGLGLRLYWADLRLGLPPSLAGQADLVFSDPPYTREGVELFVRRGLQALADRPGARVLFCYGTNHRSGEKLLAIQEMLVRLRLVLEDLRPGFNRYRGAHAIGATSALWACRPTRATRPAVEGAEARIYSRGRASREASPASIPAPVLDAVRTAAAQSAGSLGLVGEGWGSWKVSPAPGQGAEPVAITIGELLSWAGELPHPGRRTHWADVLAVNLGHFHGASLPRVVMAAPPGSELLVLAEGKDLASVSSGDLRRMVEARFQLGVIRPPQGTAPGILRARPVGAPTDATAWVLGYLQDHQAARLRNAWREALCALASRQGRSCTKNQARAVVEAAGMRPWELDSHLPELPVHRLCALVQAVDSTTPAEPPDPPERPAGPAGEP